MESELIMRPLSSSGSRTSQRSLSAQAGSSQRSQAGSSQRSLSAPMVPLGCPYSAYTAVNKGGFGTVFRVRARTGEEYALKNVTAGLGALTPLEIDVACRIRHPNLAGAVAVVSKDEIAPCPGMEAFNLGLLMHYYVPLRSLPTPSLDSVMGQLADGLHFLHTQGFLHLDIKLDNALYDPVSGQAMISDFGLSTYVGSAISVSMRRPIGTTAWMAPELVRFPFRATRATDVFSLGVLFYELITRKWIPAGVQGPTKGMDMSDLPNVAEALRVGRVRELNGMLLSGDPTVRPEALRVTIGMLMGLPASRPTLVQVMVRLKHAVVDKGFADDQALPPTSTTLVAQMRAHGDTMVFTSVFQSMVNYFTTDYPHMPVRAAFLAFDIYMRILAEVDEFETTIFFAACVYLSVIYTLPRTTHFPVPEFLTRNPDLITTAPEFDAYIIRVVKATEGRLNRTLLCDSATTVSELQAALATNVDRYFAGIPDVPEASPVAYTPTFEEFTRVEGRP